MRSCPGARLPRLWLLERTNDAVLRRVRGEPRGQRIGSGPTVCIAPVLHAPAPRRAHPHLAERPRGRPKAGDQRASEEACRRGLAHLQSAEFLYETALFPDLEYTFKHALTHEVAYGGLLQGPRRALHARIVAAIERLYAERLAEQVEHLAHHALRAEEWEKAAAYLRQAGDRAAARFAKLEAAELFARAVNALDHLPESPDRRVAAMQIRGALRAVLLPLAEFDRIFELLAAIEADAIALGDEAWLGRVAVWRGEYTPGYPGSTCTLTYDPKGDQPKGTYFWAVMRPTFDVVFIRMK